jgi:DNA polymerase III epsilon subunit-like protein
VHSTNEPIPWHLLPGPLLLLDLETTGVRAPGDRIVELAAVRHAPGEPSRTLHTLVDHGGSVVGASRIHGITRTMLDGAPSIDEVLPLLAEMSQDATMVAHNASFEHRFLSAAMERHGGCWGLPRLCTLALARRLHPERRRPPRGHGLGKMAGLYSIPVVAAHTALGDVRMMSALLGQMLRRFADHPDLSKWIAESTRTSPEAHNWPPIRQSVRLKPRWTAPPPAAASPASTAEPKGLSA